METYDREQINIELIKSERRTSLLQKVSKTQSIYFLASVNNELFISCIDKSSSFEDFYFKINEKFNSNKDTLSCVFIKKQFKTVSLIKIYFNVVFKGHLSILKRLIFFTNIFGWILWISS